MPIRYVDEEPIATAPRRVRYLEDAPPTPVVSQMQGFREGMQTVAQNLEPALSVLPFSAPNTIQRRQMNDLNQRVIDHAEGQGVQGGDFGKFWGKMVGSAPLAMIPGVGAAVGGGLMGYAGSEGDSLQDKAVDAGLGAAGGKIGGAIIDKVADVATPLLSPAVRRLTEQGVKLTPGQAKGAAAIANEDKLMSRPFVGDAIAEGRRAFLESANRASVNEALAPLGIKLPANAAAGHDAVAFAQDVVSAAYEKVVPQLAVRADPRLVAGIRDVYTSTVTKLPEAQQAQFQAILKGVNFGDSGQLAGKQLQNAVSDLGRLARSYGTSANAVERELGRAIGGVKSAMDDLMVRQNPEAAPALKATNDAWRRLTVVEDAASRADDGVASTAQIRDAARRADPSRRKAATAGGKGGPMQQLSKDLREVGAVKVPNPGTADRVLQASMIGNVMGLGSLAGYRLGQAGLKFAQAQSPKMSAEVRQLIRSLRSPAALLGASASTQGRK